MKTLRTLTILGGLVILALAIGFIFQLRLVTSLWPWPDGRLSYLFIGSILAAVSVAALWIGWTGEFGALPAGSLNVLVIAATTAVYFFQLVLQGGRPEMIPFGVVALVSVVASGAAFLWSRRIPLNDSRPMPLLVRVSFGVFIVSLIMAGGALAFRIPVFPWALNPDSSVIFGCIFIGDAFYFLYGLLYPRWHNAAGQLLSFLAYDLVLIGPFLLLFETVKPEYMLNLIVYVAVLVYSGGLAVYFLFVNSQTRLGS
ncbi:hypothetical protein ANAEL_03478 [Anaerolineales bacterium]|nr:hypothetical protein ANAEL_03478 [Anaerolineales bacterium]